LTLGLLQGYVSHVWKIKKEIPVYDRSDLPMSDSREFQTLKAETDGAGGRLVLNRPEL
jgi:hypothetical protein